MKKKFLLFSLVVIVGVVSAAWWMQRGDVQPSGSNSQNTNMPSDPDDTFDKTRFSTSDASSIWVVANKQRPLSPKNYVPTDLVVPDVPKRSNITGDERQLRKEAAGALEKLVASGAEQGLAFTMQSGYRSYNFQTTLYNRYVAQQGQATADTQSARPGYSEHQTGLAVDVGSKEHPECDVEACFGTTPEGEWLKAHAADYGFIIRYTEGNERTTGYIAEPWHLRYVGTDLAQEMKKQDIATLEQFFGFSDAPNYD